MLVFTSCTNNYLPKARVLAQSVKVCHPEWEFCLLLGEKPPADFNLDREPFDRLLGYGDLGIPNLAAWMFGHRLVELCTAVKGIALNHFLERERHPRVIYLDPDILVLASLQPLAVMLERHDILLTPHQLEPQSGARAIVDNEICSLRHGVFNLGFLACANRQEGVEFSRFWRHRLENYCRDDKTLGLFTDQKWCDLAPAYFPTLGIVRDPGCNAASWNLTDRYISQDEHGQFLANGQPLRFYHFTGYDSGMGRIMSEAYGGHMPAVASLWERYGRLLDEAGQKELGRLRWSGGVYSDGKPISDEARLYYRENPHVQSLYPDPYLEMGEQGFSGHWRRHASRENNRLYVWARKPFRLARLTALYLGGKGGLRAVPFLWRRLLDIYRQDGLPGILAKVRKFKHSCAGTAIKLQQLLKPTNDAMARWHEALHQAFTSASGVLMLDHMYGGGANDYREKRLASLLAEGRPCLLATWDFFGRRLRLSFRLPDGRTLDVEGTDPGDLLRQSAFAFNRIIVNELVLWSTAAAPAGNRYAALPTLLQTILALKDKDRAALEVAVHDFYAICPSHNLLEKGKTYCHVSRDMDRCHACLRDGPFETQPDFNLGQWRSAWGEFLGRADEIRVFSMASADILRVCYELKDTQIRHVPHEPLAPLSPVQPAAGPMSVAVVGHVAYHKGSEVVRELATLLAPDERLTVIGSLEGPLPPNVTVTGVYGREQLPDLVRRHGINCCLVPSIWPETFCYVVQEIMQMGLPLVVFPLGAQAERTAAYARGVVARGITAADALAALRQLSCDPAN